MRIRFEVIVVLIALAVGYYLYRTNWFAKLRADFSIGADHISILAVEKDYNNCKVKLTGEYVVEVARIRQGERRSIPFFEFQQWNRTPLQSIPSLGKEVEISLRCDEGRKTEIMQNPYAGQ